MLRACVISGALIAGASEELLTALRTYARGIGLAFQIIDDILDVTASSDVLGKTAGKDLAADKTTYPKLLGLEESRRRADAPGERSQGGAGTLERQGRTPAGPGRLHHQSRPMSMAIGALDALGELLANGVLA